MPHKKSATVRSGSFQLVPIVLALILLVAVFTRFYRLPQTLQFLGDQGRDAILVSRIWRQFDLPFIGPVTSIGNVYLGPIYYYYMLPWLWMSYPSPLGPAYGVAILSILTVYLLYRWGKEMVGEKPALIAAALFTISSQAILYGRFSWNPNPAPLFSLLFIYGLFKTKFSYWWWVAVAISIAILIQLHYVTLLAVPVAGIVWLYQLYKIKSSSSTQNSRITFGLASGLALIIFLGLISPLFLFDLKHHGQNLAAFWSMLGPKQEFGHTTVASPLAKLWLSIREMHGRSIFLIVAPWWALTTSLATLVVAVFGGTLVWIYRSSRKTVPGLALLSLFFLISLVGLSFYGHSVFDHYVLFLLPITCLLWSLVHYYLARTNKILTLVAAVALGLAATFNLARWPMFGQASPSLDLLQQTAQIIWQEVLPGEKYNIVLLSETKDYYGSNYRYFLTTNREKSPLIPERDDLNMADKLIIIDETKLTDDINSIQQAEIRAFPNKTPSKLIEVPQGPRLFVLQRQ